MGYLFTTPKTKHSIRRIPIPEFVLNELRVVKKGHDDWKERVGKPGSFPPDQPTYLYRGGLYMRMKTIELNSQGLLNIDIMDLPINCEIIISEGKAKLSELPAFAETKITTHQGKVTRVKWDEGEAF